MSAIIDEKVGGKFIFIGRYFYVINIDAKLS